MHYLKNRFFSELQKYKQDTSTLDKIVIWFSRALMLFAATHLTMQGYDKWWLIWIHIVCLFPIELLHLLTFENSFFNKVSYSLNAHAGWFIVISSFFTHYINLYDIIEKYDWIMHGASGLLSVYVGFYVIKPLLEPKTKHHNQLLAFFSFCFANFVIVGWELFEFISDYIIGSNNQRFDFIPDPDSWIFQLLGMGNTTEAHYPLFDTMFDTAFAFIGAIIATLILYYGILAYRLHKENLKTKAEEIEEKQAIVNK
ncbi:MAG: hypothetical protein R3Y27_00510 [Clostridia bacterium]